MGVGLRLGGREACSESCRRCHRSASAVKIRILVVSDIRLHREWLATGCAGQADIAVVGAAGCRREAEALALRLQPALVILDRSMPESLVALREILAAAPSARVLLHAVQETEPAIAVCADAGAAGYLPRDAAPGDLPRAARTVIAGDLVCSPTVAGFLARRAIAAPTNPDHSCGALTGRETQIARLVEIGNSNKEIARLLGIELATVKNHVHRLLRKLHVQRRSQVAARWRSLVRRGPGGWVSRSAG
jgi:two-component system, NarL family, nitrate/nitrite response regulator NarL